MSLEVAGLLLDFVEGTDGESTPLRLADAVDRIESFDSDDRAAVELARVAGGGHLDAVSAGRAVDLLDVLAHELGVQVEASATAARLAEDLFSAVGDIVEDLKARVSALPAPVRSACWKWVGKRTRLHVADIAALPTGQLAVFVERLERAEAAEARKPPAAGEAA